MNNSTQQLNINATKNTIGKLIFINKLGYYSLSNGEPQSTIHTNLDGYEFTKPTEPINLLSTFDKGKTIEYIKNFDTSIDPLVNFIVSSGINKSKDTIVSYRACLRKILTTPYVAYSWSCYTYKKNGCIYLYEDYDPKFFDNVIKGIHYNNYFRETICGIKDDIYSVSQWKLNDKYSIIIGSLFDGLYHDKDIKLKVLNKNQYDNNKLGNKLLDIWSQCYLDNINSCICGFYDDTQKIKKIKRFSQTDLSQTYDTKICINYLTYVLDFLQQNLKDDQLYQIERNSTGLSITEIS